MRDIIDQGPFTPPQAFKLGLVDQLVSPNEIDQFIENINHSQLVPINQIQFSPNRWEGGPAIAIIIVEGDIVRGKSMTVPLLGYKLVGDETIAESLTWARMNNEIKGIVIRVNSPGGSAMASDHLWREVKRTQAVKPVVISMGDMAASGGYFISCSADRVFAQPSTITGSIGIFTGKFDLGGLLKHLDIGVDTDSRGKHAAMEGFERPYTEEEQAFILSKLQHYYHMFLKAVSQGRKMSIKTVEEVSKGRVWTGRQALGKGLIDDFGGLIEAIEDVKVRARLSPQRPIRLYVLPKKEEGILSRAVSLLKTDHQNRLFEIKPIRDILEDVPPVLLHETSGEPLARIPYRIGIE
jgi:protease-4